MADPWDWQDDGFKLDGESPLEITRCLWDELVPSEEDSRSLFSTPLTDIALQDPPFYSFRGHQDTDSLAQRFCNSGLQGGGNGLRMKRRRLLFSEDPIYDHCDPHVESDGVIESFTNCIDPIMQVCSSELDQPLDARLDVDSLQTDSLWYRQCDDMPSPFCGVEMESHNWLAKSTDNADFSNAIQKNTKFDSIWPEEQCLPRREEDLIQGPATPLRGRSPMYNSDAETIDPNKGGGEPDKKKRQLSPRQLSPRQLSPGQFSPPTTPPVYPKSSTPVAYPFTLLKPSETEGDITLKEINQRILMTPSRPLPHLQQGQKQQLLQLHAADENSWSFGGCCSPTDQGLGLSGKSIVARTKIHTEGNGTITIMRTRG